MLLSNLDAPPAVLRRNLDASVLLSNLDAPAVLLSNCDAPYRTELTRYARFGPVCYKYASVQFGPVHTEPKLLGIPNYSVRSVNTEPIYTRYTKLFGLVC